MEDIQWTHLVNFATPDIQGATGGILTLNEVEATVQYVRLTQSFGNWLRPTPPLVFQAPRRSRFIPYSREHFTESKTNSFSKTGVMTE